jgi:translation initiation factor 1
MAKRKNRGNRGARPTKGDGWEFIPAQRAAMAEGVKRFKSDPPSEQKIAVRVEKRNKGKMVTVARGFRLIPADMKTLAKTLKTTCASGGKATEEAVEIQGRHLDKVLAALLELGYQAKAK